MSNNHVSLYSKGELLRLIGARAKQRRLAVGMRQEDLSRAAGVPIATVRRFESGKSVGFESVILIGLALGAETEFASLFPAIERRSLDDVLQSQRQRRRARRRT